MVKLVMEPSYNSSNPTPVSGGLSFSSITGGNRHICGLVITGDAYCWGMNAAGQLGDGTTTNKSVPTLVGGGLSFISIKAGHPAGNNTGQTCGITAANDMYCWGYNGDGQLGDGTTTDSATPTLVSGGLKFTSVAVARNTRAG